MKELSFIIPLQGYTKDFRYPMLFMKNTVSLYFNYLISNIEQLMYNIEIGYKICVVEFNTYYTYLSFTVSQNIMYTVYYEKCLALAIIVGIIFKLLNFFKCNNFFAISCCICIHHTWDLKK